MQQDMMAEWAPDSWGDHEKIWFEQINGKTVQFAYFPDAEDPMFAYCFKSTGPLPGIVGVELSLKQKITDWTEETAAQLMLGARNLAKERILVTEGPHP